MSLKTVLLDLDDTLLTVDMSAFVAAYVDGFAQALAEFGPQERIAALILQATRSVRTGSDTTLSNQQRYDRLLLASLSISAGQLQRANDHFFERYYPQLRRYTRPVREALPLVDYLFEQQYRVAIATNPLYPQPAIEQRLAWAGLSDFPYALVTSMQNMHFCKPDTDYYREILAYLGSSPGETLMVGDNYKNDIAPSGELGCKTWWITDASAPPDGTVTAGYCGTLAGCHQWLRLNGLRGE